MACRESRCSVRKRIDPQLQVAELKKPLKLVLATKQTFLFSNKAVPMKALHMWFKV